MRSSRTPTASTAPPTAACGCAWRGRRSELHYGSAAQPLGREARDQLLAWLGFTELEYAPPAPENDRAVVCGGTELRLSELLIQANNSVRLQADPLDVVFVER